jgi:hypothetical protein
LGAGPATTTDAVAAGFLPYDDRRKLSRRLLLGCRVVDRRFRRNAVVPMRSIITPEPSKSYSFFRA